MIKLIKKLFKVLGLIMGAFLALAVGIAIFGDTDSSTSDRSKPNITSNDIHQVSRYSEEAIEKPVSALSVVKTPSKPSAKLVAKIKALDEELKSIPQAYTHANLVRYKNLLKLSPDSERYAEKVDFYEAQLSPTYKVIGISDGDTVTLLSSSKEQLKVRLVGIDSPERGQEYGNKAKDYVGALLKKGGGNVRIESTGKDRYGRTLARIYLPDKTYVNEQIVKAGYGWHYKEYNKDQDLSLAEDYARERKKGLWKSDIAPMSPWDYRSRQKVAAEIKLQKQKAELLKKDQTAKPKIALKYWLNTSSSVRHNQACRYYNNTKRGRGCSGTEGKACGICGG